MSEEITLQTVIDKFLERDKNEVDAFNSRYGWDVHFPIEAHLAFVSDRLKDAIEVLVYVAKYVASQQRVQPTPESRRDLPVESNNNQGSAPAKSG